MIKPKQKNVAFIFARGGSKELKNKNIYLLNNKPLISYTIELAKSCEIFDDIVISTDSKKIALISESYGVKVNHLRPKHLASDDSPEILSWKYEIERYLNNKKFDKFFSLPCTSPLRIEEDIIEMNKFFDKNKHDLVLGVTKSSKSPLFNIVEKDNFDNIKVILNNNSIFRRQDSVKYFDITTVCYISTPEYILNSESIFDGRVGGYEIPKERSLDIDTEYDMNIASFLINKHDN